MLITTDADDDCLLKEVEDALAGAGREGPPFSNPPLFLGRRFRFRFCFGCAVLAVAVDAAVPVHVPVTADADPAPVAVAVVAASACLASNFAIRFAAAAWRGFNPSARGFFAARKASDPFLQGPTPNAEGSGRVLQEGEEERDWGGGLVDIAVGTDANTDAATHCPPVSACCSSVGVATIATAGTAGSGADPAAAALSAPPPPPALLSG